MWHTVVLAVATTAGSIVLGLALALLLEGQTRALWFVRLAVFLPVVTAMAVGRRGVAGHVLPVRRAAR
ncbi:hypothetical protein SALBM217S_01410 [Streptomyces griseoloalbus]